MDVKGQKPTNVPETADDQHRRFLRHGFFFLFERFGRPGVGKLVALCLTEDDVEGGARGVTLGLGCKHHLERFGSIESWLLS